MIDKALTTISQSGGGDAFYFQLYPLSLTIVGEDSEVPAPGTTYRFTIMKGQQKFDETRLPIEANYKKANGVNVMVMPKCPLNFYVPNFSKGRGAEFAFNMFQTENKTEYFIAEYLIEVQPYILEFKNSRTVRFEHKTKFSQDYELQFEVYLEKSRFALEKVVKDYKVERTLKSPLRERKQSPGGSINKTEHKDGKRVLAKESEKSELNQSEKANREEFTEMSSEPNKLSRGSTPRGKVKQEEVIVEDHVEEKAEEKPVPKPTARTENEEERSIKKETISREEEGKFAKNKMKSGAPSETSSKKQAPVVQVRFKPVTTGEQQINMGTSQMRQSGSVIISQQPVAVHEEGNRQKIYLSLFLLFSFVMIYFSMHPSRKV